MWENPCPIDFHSRVGRDDCKLPLIVSEKGSMGPAEAGFNSENLTAPKSRSGSSDSVWLSMRKAMSTVNVVM
ncbi:hypothetical protein TorRG33x02_008220 [Trema orientale]|uniref:Uncharacterized protein n=1 Tax=Trema orientale TaxID=63057 RepID=A0A2P5G0S0_TREOI|nr:hypothetical protein TorRG33x02_008220 [Trema orientale]